MMDFLTGANQYFALHLDKKVWDSLVVTDQQAALTGAVNDINDYLAGSPEPDSELMLRAVCEQALHLLKLQQKKPQMLSESIEGIGSRSYLANQNSEDNHIVCVRSRQILAPVVNRIHHNISRG